MRTSLHPEHAFQSRHFGRRKSLAAAIEPARSNWANDLRLFATTFVAGFLFVSLYLA
jgi:hypothetical protein